MPDVQKALRLGMDLQPWYERVEALIADGARIISFRGAGAVNGIEPDAAEAAVALLHSYVKDIAETGTPVALMYDGDGDNRSKPDIGSVFGGLVDSLAGDRRITALAAQTEGWYNPDVEDGAIESAASRPFETYVFADELPGAHASLTQAEGLVAYPGYEQIIVGPAGPIALGQLKDLSSKTAQRPTSVGPLKVTVLRTPNNPAVGSQLESQLASAVDEQARAKVVAKLDQRSQQPYGALFTPGGEFSVDHDQFPGIEFNVFPVKSE